MKRFFLKSVKFASRVFNKVKIINLPQKRILSVGALFLIIVIFGWFYFDMIFSLPLFGDATIQGKITKDILHREVLNTRSPYPALYNVFQGILFSVFGEKGMNSIVFFGVLFIALSIFLLTRELTGKNSIALFATIITLGSPKIIFYSARMYMEVLISGFFIFTIFLLFKFIKNKSIKNLILLVFFTAITSILKQQGLFILFPSILIFLLFLLIINIVKKIKKLEKSGIGASIKHIILFLFIFLLVILPFYLVLFRSNGEILPGVKELKIIRFTNYIGQKITGYKEPKEDIEFNRIWKHRVEEIRKEYYPKGITRAEKRHIWPWGPFTSWKKFTGANGLYIENFAQGKTSKDIANVMNFTLVFGLAIFVLNLIFKNKFLKFKSEQSFLDEQGRRNKEILDPFFYFFLIFLSINYFLFLRTTDQMRYHLFIPILFSIFSGISIFFFYNFVLKKIRIKYLELFSICSIIILFLFFTINLTYKDTLWNKRWYRSQLYGPSKGGIPSVAEAGKWLKENTKEDEIIWQTCNNETAYYAERKIEGNFWYYFLESFELKQIFKDRDQKYIVIFDSQIVPDEKWINLCWIPESFNKKIKKIFPLAFQTSYGDIKIYEVQ